MDAGHRRTYSGREGRYQWVEAPRSVSTMFREDRPPLGAGFLTGQVKNPGDKTMASVSLQSRLTLNCKLSGRTKFGSALTVGIV